MSKRHTFHLSFLYPILILSLFHSLPALQAREVAPSEAQRAAINWLGRAGKTLRPGGTVQGIQTVEDGDGSPLFHVAELSGGGFVVLGPDRRISPILAFSETGNGFCRDSSSPLYRILTRDIQGRKRSLGKPASRTLSAFPSSPSTPAEKAWERLLNPPPTPLEVDQVDDLRVPALVHSTWGQSDAGGRHCYNYFTPKNYPCGCVATAFAQILRYHRYPTAPVEPATYSCGVDQQATDLTLLGGTYSWDQMPLVPGFETTDEERRAIGKLCYDLGVVCKAWYGPQSTGAWTAHFAGPNGAGRFHYASAYHWQLSNAANPDPLTLERGLLANFDAKMPVAMALPGHLVVADGYGYIDRALYVHVNLGWDGSSTAWYALPDVAAYEGVSSFVYNIFPTRTGNILSGRVLDVDGNPVSGHPVTALCIDSGASYGKTTDGHGIYAFILPPEKTYRVSTPSGTAPQTIFLEGSRSGGAPNGHLGNYWGADLPTTLGLPQRTLFWNGGAGGEWRDDSRANWLTPQGEASTWQEGSDAVFTNGGTVVVAPEGISVRSLRFDSPVPLTFTGGALTLVRIATITATRGNDVTLGIPLAGENGLKITHGHDLLFDRNFLTLNEQCVFPSTRLSEIGRIEGFIAGGSVSSPGWALPCQDKTLPDGSRSIQFQIQDDRYTKSVKVLFVQRGQAVHARAVWAKYKEGFDTLGSDFEIDAGTPATLAGRPGQGGYGISRLRATCLPGRFRITVPTRLTGDLEIVRGRVELENGATFGAGGYHADPLLNQGELILSKSWQTFGGRIRGKGRIVLSGSPSASRSSYILPLPVGGDAEPFRVAENRSLADLTGATGEPIGSGIGKCGDSYLPFFPLRHGTDRMTLHLQTENDTRTFGVVLELFQQGTDIAARVSRAYFREGKLLGTITDGTPAPVAEGPHLEGYGIRNLELFFGCSGATFLGKCEWQGGLSVLDGSLVQTLGGAGLPALGTIETGAGGEIRFHERADAPLTLWVRPRGEIRFEENDTFSDGYSRKAIFMENGTLHNASSWLSGMGNYVNRLTLSQGSRVHGSPLLTGESDQEAWLRVGGREASRQEAGYHLQGSGTLNLEIEDVGWDTKPDLIFTGPLTSQDETQSLVRKRGEGTILFQSQTLTPGTLSIEEGAVRLLPPPSSLSRFRAIEVKGGARFECAGEESLPITALTLEKESTLLFLPSPQGCPALSVETLTLPEAGSVVIGIETAESLPRGQVLTLITGQGLDPSRLNRLSLDLSRSPGLQGSLSIQNSSLRFTVTSTGEQLSPLTWNTGNGAWNTAADNRVWKTGTGSEVPFTQNKDAIFSLPASTSARIQIAPDIRPGILVDRSAGDLTLAGAKLLGSASFIKSGSGVLTLDGEGFENQSIQISAGQLKLGPHVTSPTLLGSPAAPLNISGSGSLDLNSTGPDAPLCTQKIRISESGGRTSGAIANSGPVNGGGIAGIESLGSTVLSGPSGWTIKNPKGRAKVTAPRSSTVTLLGPMREKAAIGVEDADVRLGTLSIGEGASFRATGSSLLHLESMLLEGRASASFGGLNAPLAFPVEIRGPAKLGTIGGETEFAGPITLTREGALELFTVGDGVSRTLYTGGISAPGKGIRISSGIHLFASDLDLDELNVLGGSVQFGDPQRGNTSGKVLPKRIKLAENTVLTLTSRSEEAHYRNTEIEGRRATLVPGYALDDSPSTLTHVRVEMADQGVLKAGRTPTSSKSRIRLGEGSSITVETLEIQDSGEAGSVDFQIGSGSELTVLGRTDHACRIGHWPSHQQGRITVNGGTFHLPNTRPQIGWDGWDSAFYLNGGVLKSPRGINIRTHIYAPDNNYKTVFVMNGGRLELGDGMVTALGSPRLPLVYLNGGEIKTVADWSVKPWLPLVFGPREGMSGKLILDTAGRNITFPTALRGASAVTVSGTGTFTAWSGSAGGPTGIWTLENQGGNDLRNASAFAAGLILAQNVDARIRIGDQDHHVAMGTLCNRSGGDTLKTFFNQTGRPRDLLAGQIHAALLMEHGLADTAFAYAGEFLAEESGVHTFSLGDAVTGLLRINGTEVCNTRQRQDRAGTIELQQGWNAFSLIIQNNGEALSTSPSVWKQAGKVIGWRKGADTAHLEPSGFASFDTDTLSMRPAPSATLRRVANTYGNPGNWMERSDFNDFETLGSLRETLHTHTWVKGCGSVNEITGWFRVDQAAGWRFKGSYDDQIALWVDGKLLFQTARWDDVRESETIPLSRGLHAFRVRFMDTSSNTGQAWGKPDDQVLWYRIGDGNYTPFNEESLVITAEPYGFIGGELALAPGALLTNDASSPCSVTGTLRGEGTLEGLFRLEGAVWEVRCKAGRLKPERVVFEKADPDALRDVGKIKVLFDAKPLLARYPITPALGLPGDAESLSERVEASLPDGTVLDLIPGIDPDGRLVLTNPHVETGTLILIR